MLVIDRQINIPNYFLTRFLKKYSFYMQPFSRKLLSASNVSGDDVDDYAFECGIKRESKNEIKIRILNESSLYVYITL